MWELFIGNQQVRTAGCCYPVGSAIHEPHASSYFCYWPEAARSVVGVTSPAES